MGSLCLFTRQRALKIGYFYWLHVKNRITFTQTSALVTQKTQSFILKVKRHLLT